MNLVPVEFRRGSQITLEFRKVVNCPVGAGTWTQVLLSTELLGALRSNLLAAFMDGRDSSFRRVGTGHVLLRNICFTDPISSKGYKCEAIAPPMEQQRLAKPSDAGRASAATLPSLTPPQTPSHPATKSLGQI